MTPSGSSLRKTVAMPTDSVPTSEASPLVVLWGNTARDAAWRGLAVFMLGYVLPRLLAGHAVPPLQGLATGLAFIFVTLAVYRWQIERDAQRAGDAQAVVLLADDAVQQGTLDAVVADAAPQAVAKPRKWTAELLPQLEWRRMADLCIAFYKERGMSGEVAAVGEDGSLEVRLYQGERTEDSPVFALLFCKARGKRELGVDAVTGLVARMQAAGVGRAFFMGAWSFDQAAQALARERQITLIDDRMFLSLLTRLPYDESQRLLNLAVEGDYATPTCPACGFKMIPRQNENGRYWGCRAYPRCKATLGMRA